MKARLSCILISHGDDDPTLTDSSLVQVGVVSVWKVWCWCGRCGVCVVGVVGVVSLFVA